MFNTSLDRIFGVQKYADSLMKIVKQRDIQLNFKRNLIQINPDTQEATFEVLDGSVPKKLETYEVHCRLCLTALYYILDTSDWFLFFVKKKKKKN